MSIWARGHVLWASGHVLWASGHVLWARRHVTKINFLKILTNAGEILLALISDILDLSKIEAGELHVETIPFDLHDLTKETHNILGQKAMANGTAFVCHIQPDCPRVVVGDPLRLRQILLNLLGNAIKFTDKGKIVLKVEAHSGDRIQFTVSDTGIGISGELLENIFNPFRQGDDSTFRRFGGTGLGLSICSRLAQAMGGDIQVESKVGKGTVFQFTARFPRPEEAMFHEEPTRIIRAEERKTTSERPPPEQAMNILLVDDDESNRLVIKAFLNNTPYRITEAINGEEAVQAFRSAPFDCVLMDMQMPILDGYRATEQIRAWEKERGNPPTPIFALTADAMREDIEKTVASGCNMHLSKPVGKARLLDLLRRFHC